MKGVISVTILLIISISFIPLDTQLKKISTLERPELLRKLTSSTPFDFPQQWRKTKKDSDEWFRSVERFNARNQGITPLWACVYSKDGNETQNPIIRATTDGGLIVGCTYRPAEPAWYTGIIKLSSDSSIEWQFSFLTDYGVNQINCVEQTNDGGCIVGMRGHHADHGFLILKLSPNGNIEWVGSYVGNLGEYVHSIKQTSDGGYIVVGVTGSFGNPNFNDPNHDGDINLLAIKLSPKGDIEWQRAFGGPTHETEWIFKARKSTIIESSHGGYIVVCDTESFTGKQWPDLWIVKLSDLGEIEWQRVIGGKESEWMLTPGSYATETTDGKYIIACHTWSYGVINTETNRRSSEIWVLKLKPNGDVEWQKTYGEKGSDTVRAVQATSNGGCIVVGASNSWLGSNSVDFWVFKISPTGKIIWEHTYGGEFWDEATSVCITSDNGLAMAGTTSSFDNEDEEQDLLVFKVTSDGKLDTMCSNLVGESNAVVMDTDAVPFDTYEVAIATDIVKSTAKITAKVINVKKNLICWNLNQPPVNLFFERVENKSFFASEAWNTITWSPNPYNSPFSITEYNIYRKNADYETFSYEYIATVPANFNIFVDTKRSNTQMDENARYLYVVTSVDSEGNESPRSDAVGNLN